MSRLAVVKVIHLLEKKSLVELELAVLKKTANGTQDSKVGPPYPIRSH